MRFATKAAVLSIALELLHQHNTRGPNRINGRVIVDDLFTNNNDEYVVATYRLSGVTIVEMVATINPFINVTNCTKYTTLTRILVTLFYLAHGTSFNLMHATFNIPSTTVEYIVWQIVPLIYHCYQSSSISYKDNNSEWFTTQANLFDARYNNIPYGVFGAVDCTYIYVITPDDEPIVAILVVLELQEPPVAASLTVIVLPMHTVLLPNIVSAGNAVTFLTRLLPESAI